MTARKPTIGPKKNIESTRSISIIKAVIEFLYLGLSREEKRLIISFPSLLSSPPTT